MRVSTCLDIWILKIGQQKQQTHDNTHIASPPCAMLKLACLLRAVGVDCKGKT